MPSTIEIFIHEDAGGDGIGLVVCDASIVEYGDELAPGCCLTIQQAAQLAAALTALIDQTLQEL